ncbi:NADPH-dependent oxidoreductase [Staphylococcus lugdunensis]|uniref:NADPH-dependent oxidoreductase n=1 Tax=Staphylococcus lugdunensis TaxID=28035 RepID=UPI001F4C796D|nr:NADPH-dependent oxidoreductase [Staphylococcus lugdunensis]
MSEYAYELMKEHHSVRQFKDKPLSDDVVRKLVEAGQSASTSSYLQTYSIIGVDDPQIKTDLKEVSGQPYVVDNGYLFVFVLDYYRHQMINERTDNDMTGSFESAEGLLVGTIDVALVAENMAVAAEDMGYGIVYLGSLRNDVGRVRDILDLPEYTFPLFGLAIGEPADDEQGTPKPRLPYDSVFHQNKYNADKDNITRVLIEYDQLVSDYYKKRTNGARVETWSDQVQTFLSNKPRLDMLEQLNKAGFMKR